MALTDQEKERARDHLGYPEVQALTALTFGVARPLQTLFLVEQALNSLLPVAENRVRSILGVLDGVECRLIAAQDRLAAKRIDNLELRDDEPAQLEAEYRRWGYRLADTLGVPIYAYSVRYRREGKMQAGNVAVG